MWFFIDNIKWYSDDKQSTCIISEISSKKSLYHGIVHISPENEKLLDFVTTVFLDNEYVLFVSDVKRYFNEVLTPFVIRHVKQQLTIPCDVNRIELNYFLNKIATDYHKSYIIVHSIFSIEKDICVNYIPISNDIQCIDSQIRNLYIDKILKEYI